MAPKKKKLTKQQKKFKREFKKKQDENPSISISEAVLNIVDSFLRKYLAPEEPLPPMEVIVNLAVLGWNHSFLSEENQQNIYDSIDDNSPPEFGAKLSAEVTGLINKFAAEKRLLYPNVKRMITEHKYRTDEFGEKLLNVSSVDIDEKRI